MPVKARSSRDIRRALWCKFTPAGRFRSLAGAKPDLAFRRFAGTPAFHRRARRPFGPPSRQRRRWGGKACGIFIHRTEYL